MNLPNLLTLLRIFFVPLLVAALLADDSGVIWLRVIPVSRELFALGIFLTAAASDLIDGYLARRWGETSAFGAFLDPVADKLMVAAALILLVELGRAEAYLAIIIIGREIAISALREWMAQLGRSRKTAVAFVGKIKTVAQMTALIALLLWENVIPGVSTALLGTFALWVAAILTLWSMFHYLRLAAPHFRTEVATREAGMRARKAKPRVDAARPPVR
jgi:CDP-diacylglycerol--glycerol-3-phosphate 3-phosphatidyltransferase/cardiolipin synthase